MAKENTKATPLTEEQLIQKEADLKAGEEKLANDRKEFEEKVQNFKSEKEQFEKDKSEFAEQAGKNLEMSEKLILKKQELDDREANVSKKEKDLDQLESDLLSADPQPNAPEPGYEFSYNGQKFKFTDSAPKSIRYKNKVWKQKELAKDEEAIAEFVNTSLIQKL